LIAKGKNPNQKLNHLIGCSCLILEFLIYLVLVSWILKAKNQDDITPNKKPQR